MNRAFVIAKKKPQYAPMMDAVQRAGIPILDFKDDLRNYDQLIVFHTKYFEALETNATVGWWMCDYRTPRDLIVSPRANCDHIFLPYLDYHTMYENHFGAPVTFMPQHGVEWPAQPEARNLNADAVFIGHAAPNSKYHYNRGKLLKLISTICHLRHIAGEGTTRDMRSIYRKTPVSINITPPNMGGTSNRLFNILSSGGLCLTSWFFGIERMFRNGEHLIWFKTEDELFETLTEIIDDTGKNLRIRTAGADLYRAKHTAQHRIDNMFDILSGNETEFRGFLEDEPRK